MGTKSENEKFAGGLKTTTVEGFIPTTGRGIQGGTSHCLGQNFSKMFDICVENPDPNKKETDPKKLFVWQNSWGLSTRTIGVMVMIHGDDKGLVMPPMVSQIQVVIIPCGIRASTVAAVLGKVEEIETSLKGEGVRVRADIRDTYREGWKFNQYELKVSPLHGLFDFRASLFASKLVLRILQRVNTSQFAVTQVKNQPIPSPV
jgi:prolyl-tRNA synthetase